MYCESSSLLPELDVQDQSYTSWIQKLQTVYDSSFRPKNISIVQAFDILQDSKSLGNLQVYTQSNVHDSVIDMSDIQRYRFVVLSNETIDY